MSLTELGEQLRHARELRGLSLRDLEQATRIRAKYLRALEEGNLNVLSTEVQIRGFLRNYALHVGLDPESALRRLQQAIRGTKKRRWQRLFRRTNEARALPMVAPMGESESARDETIENVSVASTKRLRIRRFITPDTFVGTVFFVGLIAFFFWGGARLARSVRTPRPVVATPVRLGPIITPTFFTRVMFTPTSPPPLVNFSDVQLTLLAEQRSFVLVIVDGAIEFQGIIQGRERRDYFANDQIEVTTGNGAGIRVLFNERDKGFMGEFGEVVTWIFLPNSVSTPVPVSSVVPITVTVIATAVP